MYLRLTLFAIFLGPSLCFAKKSVTVVVDTTLSMQDEIDVIKNNLGAVLYSVDLTDKEDYVLVTFKDPDVEKPRISASPSALISHVNNLTVSGGQDCPENALAAIQEALEVSKPGSHIFIFTDAYAKDNSKLSVVQNLCLNTGSQVIIILSGSCVPSTKTPEGSIDVYFEVAKFCHGGVFQFEPVNLRKAFDLMKEIMKTDWDEVVTYDSSYRDIKFSVDYLTTDLMMIVYGNHPNLQINTYERSPIEYKSIFRTSSVLVVNLAQLQPGAYKATIRGRGRTSVTVYRKIDLPLQIGFSTKRTNILKLTSFNPVPGWLNYILIIVPPDAAIKLRSLRIHYIKTNETKIFTLEEDRECMGHYVTSEQFDHDTTFQMTVAGQDVENDKEVTKTTKVLETQKTLWGEVKEVPDTKPKAEIIAIEPKTQLVEYGSDVVLACRVVGYPKPDISWHGVNKDDLQVEDVTIEVTNIFASYATISNLKKNVTILCKAENSNGEDTKSLDLFVRRTFSFEAKQTPQDRTIEYGAEGKLYCEIEAYPEATTLWFHNGTLLTNFEKNTEMGLRNHTLLIKHMNMEDSGEYKCEVKNELETRYYTARIDIFGIESPQIGLQSTDIILKPGDQAEVDCMIKGKPVPEITWKYKSGDADSFNDIPYEINIKDGKLQIPLVKMEHSGLYRCEAFNVAGQDYHDIDIKIKYAPIIKNIPEKLTVNEGDTVKLVCDVDALPKAKVWWEMYQDDINMNFDNRHMTDDRYTHRFEALWKDSGNYHCVAENDIGRTEKTVAVNVLVAPYIKPPQHKRVVTTVGSSISLTCEVLYGNPVPSTKWEFISLRATRTILLRGNSTNTLRLSNVSKDQEGSYVCIADNDIASDSIKIDLKIL